MKNFLTAFENPVMFYGYPFRLYVLIDDVQPADDLQLIADHHTTTYQTSQFEKKGVYELELPDADSSFDVHFAGTQAGSSVQLTKTLTCFVQKRCDGIMLRWENEYAGYDYWLFGGNIRDRIRSGTQERFEPFQDDIENETANFELLKKRFEKTQRVFSDFPKSNTEGFYQLSRSRYVEMLYNDTWWKVDVDIHNISMSHFQPYGKCSLDIILPKTYVK